LLLMDRPGLQKPGKLIPLELFAPVYLNNTTSKQRLLYIQRSTAHIAKAESYQINGWT